MFEDTKVVFIIRKSKKDRQHNGQKDKQWFTKLTHKTNDQVTQTPQQNLCWTQVLPAGLTVSATLVAPVVLTGQTRVPVSNQIKDVLTC